MLEKVSTGRWWDRGWTLVEGCREVGEGCRSCWAREASWMRSGSPQEAIRARHAGLSVSREKWAGGVRFHEADLVKPLKVRRPAVWAVWNDLFHCGVTPAEQSKAFEAMGKAAGRGHRFVVLTKRPEEMRGWFAEYQPERDAFPNVWVGFSASTQEEYDAGWRDVVECRPYVAGTFVSLEPLIEAVNVTLGVGHGVCSYWCRRIVSGCDGLHGMPQNAPCFRNTLDGVIVGGETGPRPRGTAAKWVRDVRDTCRRARKPFFFKHWGELMDMDQAIAQRKYSSYESGHEARPVVSVRGSSVPAVKLGRRRTGRVLDGRTWDGLPWAGEEVSTTKNTKSTKEE